MSAYFNTALLLYILFYQTDNNLVIFNDIPEKQVLQPAILTLQQYDDIDTCCRY